MVVARGDDDAAVRDHRAASAPPGCGTRGRAPRAPRRGAGSPARGARDREAEARAHPLRVRRPGRSNAPRARSRALTPSICARARRGAGPPRTPSSCAFSRPVSCAMRPAWTDSSEPTRPAHLEPPASGREHAGHSAQERRLARPARPDQRDALARRRRRTTRRAAPQVSSPRRRSRATSGVTRRRCRSNWKRTPTPSARRARSTSTHLREVPLLAAVDRDEHERAGRRRPQREEQLQRLRQSP